MEHSGLVRFKGRCINCRILIPFLFLLVDLCRPLLVGILSDNKEEDEGGMRYDSSTRREMFLCIKQHLALEVDVKHGQERCRLELGSLARVKTTEAVWIRGVRKGTRHAFKCSHFGCCFAHCQVHSPVYFQVLIIMSHHLFCI